MSKGKFLSPYADTPIRRPAGTFPLALVLILAASLLLGACTAGETGKKDDPVFYGTAGGGNGGGGAMSGMSLTW